MYLYYDRYGTLKEQITFNPARVGNSNVNKIFVYWEGVEEFPDWAQELALQTRYLLQDNTQYPSATTFGFSAQPETAELPFDKNQDLKYFKYYKEYKFLTIDIPDEVLSYNGAVKSYIWVLNADKKRILGLGVFAFMVDGDINEVIPDENISLAQWNMISAQLGLLSGSVIDVTCDIASNTLKVYYANGLTAIRNLPPNGAQTTISSDFLREMIFSTDAWVQDGGNGYYIYFRAETVGYTDNRFFVQLERDGNYESDYYNKTGSFVLSDNIFKGSDGSVLLYSNEPYSGRLLVVGGKLLSGDSLVTGLSYNDANSQLTYKTADGITHTIYLGINEKFDKSNVSQTTGDSQLKVMSQKVVTELLNDKLFKWDVVQTTGDSTVKVMSQKAVTDNLSFQNEEISFEWHRKIINMDGISNTIYPNYISDSIIRILNIETTSENGFDITDKTIHISVENGYKYACVLYRHGKTEETFTNLVYDGEWKFYTEPTIWVANGDYKYLLIMLAKTDNSEILLTDSSSIKIEIENKATNDVKESIKLLQKNHELITLPFSDFLIDFPIYKENGNYRVSTKPTDYFVKKDNGKVVFISPNGSDSADGLTILTPVKTLNKALSISSVETIIFLEGEYVANTNFDIGTEIDISVNFIGIGNVVIDNISGSNNAPINFKSSCYVRNIHFKHGNNTVKATLSNGEVAVFDECTFSNSDGALWSNGLSILGGISYIFNCTAYNNAYDGFNYHANESVINYAFEIGCKSYNNGNTKLSHDHGQSSNATTSHDGSYIVRVNGDYYACHGGIVADLNCYSANYGCKAGVSTVTNGTSYADRMSNYWCSGSQMYLYDCTSYGSKYDTAILNNGDIRSNTQYASNYQP